MLLRKYTFVRLFATSLALASKGQYRESSEALVDRHAGNQAGNQIQWQSGDCISIKKTGAEARDEEREFKQNKPSACIKWCKTNGGFKFAGLNKQQCVCGDELPEGRVQINNERCQEPCPGLPDSVCGGGNRWWNVFSTDGKILKFQLHHGFTLTYQMRSGSVWRGHTLTIGFQLTHVMLTPDTGRNALSAAGKRISQ